MTFDDFKAAKQSNPEWKHSPSVQCNAVYKKGVSVNCYLRPTEAIQLARNLLETAQLILELGIEGAAVQLWNAGEANESLSCGIEKARKGARRRKKRTAKPVPNQYSN